METKNCKQCGARFEIADFDLKFYKKISPVFDGEKFAVNPPSTCPHCREQRRLAYRNEEALYHRKCDLSGEQIISSFHPTSPYKVYKKDYWYQDNWDAISYGRDYDFKRSFFEQFFELSLAVPKLSLIYEGFLENCDFCNRVSNCKNCYLCFSSNFCEDCYYSKIAIHSKNCLDCYNIYTSELCYQCVDCYSCYNCAWLEGCLSCSESYFLKNCYSCKNCVLCTNLSQKQYFISNKQYSKEDYFKKLKELDFSKYSNIEKAKKDFGEMRKNMIVKFYFGNNNENVSGNYLDRCKNTLDSFENWETEDCKYVQALHFAKDCMDFTHWGNKAELVYETQACGINCQRILFCNECWEESHDFLYCMNCMWSKNLFGCVGLKRKEYCIFNKQYSKEEYERLAARIIRQMQATGEWGEGFPLKDSPYAYNETVANDYFPLSKEDALSKGLKWQDDESEKMYKGPKYEIPDDINDVPDNICKQILFCEETKKLYKIIPQELMFYRKMQLPIPRKSYVQRLKELFALRNPRLLWDRNCAKCGKGIKTSYAPERSEIVYCEDCYQKEVY